VKSFAASCVAIRASRQIQNLFMKVAQLAD